MAKRFRRRSSLCRGRRLRRRTMRRTRSKFQRKRSMRSIGSNVAGVIESWDTSLAYGTAQNFAPITLNDAVYDRAQQVAKAYREFRIKKVELFFHFPFNTFAPNISGGASKPRWWFVYDPRKLIPNNFNKGIFEDMGIKPRIAMGHQKVTFIPRILTPQVWSVSAPPGFTQLPHGTKRRPWLPCNLNGGFTAWGAFLASDVQHFGCKWLTEDPVSPPQGQPYTVNVRVHFQFRKPVWYVTSSTEANVVQPAALLHAVPEQEIDEEEEDCVVEEGEATCAPPPSPEVGSSITPTSAKI